MRGRSERRVLLAAPAVEGGGGEGGVGIDPQVANAKGQNSQQPPAEEAEVQAKQGPVAKNKFATGPYLYSFSYRRQNFTPNCGKLFTFRACLRRLHRFGGA